MPNSSIGLSRDDRTSQSSGRRLLMSVADTLEALAISRSTFYVLVAAGELETVKVGSATRTVVSSAEAYVERLRAQAKAA
jgi:hypothetical protein